MFVFNTFLYFFYFQICTVILTVPLPAYIYAELPNICLINAVMFISLKIYSFNYSKDSLQRCLKSTVKDNCQLVSLVTIQE